MLLRDKWRPTTSTAVLAIVLLYPFLQQTKTTPQTKAESEACNQTLSFCWYEDEVFAYGNRWVPQDSSEKPILYNVALRCIKKLGICAVAVNQKTFGDKSVTRVDLSPITRWDNSQITADGENNNDLPCEKDTFVLNRIDRTVLMISSPGSKAADAVCTKIMGKPKTVIYKLVDDLTEELSHQK